MGNEIHAVLIDISSIQKYVFGSNRLKANIGGSFLVEYVYDEPLKSVVGGQFPSLSSINFDAWKKDPGTIRILTGDTPFEVGYIGGGNALLFFRKEDEAKSFIKEWTQALLLIAPGLVPITAFDRFDFGSYSGSMQRLFSRLTENKNRYSPQTVVPRHGLTAECPESGYSQDAWNVSPERSGYVSSVFMSKIIAAGQANRKLSDDYRVILDGRYAFTDDLEKLGQVKGEDSHIAVVHLDGNDMGMRFLECRSLEDTRVLSETVRSSIGDCFGSLLKEIVEDWARIQDSLGYDTEEKRLAYPKDNDRREIVPVRPIIIGGDDITFVTDGRLGIYFAQRLMERLSTLGLDPPISSCAGIAIVKTAYPFYRTYELAEELCRSAKERRKTLGGTGSWLDFHVAYGGYSGELEEIRARHYRSPCGSLLWRPLRIAPTGGPYGFSALRTCAGSIRYGHAAADGGRLREGWPSTKIMELREVLCLPHRDQLAFVRDCESRGWSLPVISEMGRLEGLWSEDKKTPYFDAVELMGLYPEFALREGLSKGEGDEKVRS